MRLLILFPFLILLLKTDLKAQLLLNPFKPLSEEVSDSSKVSKKGLFLLPLLYYTPDTRLAAGAMGVYYFHAGDDKINTRLSYVKLLADYTQNRQLDVWSSWNIFTKEDNFLFKGELRYRNFPDRFYGIGNNTLSSNEELFEYSLFSFKLLLMKKIKKGLFLGVDINYDNEFSLKQSAEGSLIKGNITGYNGGRAVGPGIVITWDTRDNVINAYKGSFIEFSSYFNLSVLGSSFQYNRYNFEFSKFIKLTEKTVLAFNTRAVFTNGQVPFLDMPRVGSDQILRGYPSYRYRDNNFIASQVEYRFPVYWRFGLAAFAGLGDVFKTTNNLSMQNLKHSYGIGLRYLANESERLNLRIDYGIGRNSNAFYILLTEAF